MVYRNPHITSEENPLYVYSKSPGWTAHCSTGIPNSDDQVVSPLSVPQDVDGNLQGLSERYGRWFSETGVVLKVFFQMKQNHFVFFVWSASIGALNQLHNLYWDQACSTGELGPLQPLGRPKLSHQSIIPNKCGISFINSITSNHNPLRSSNHAAGIREARKTNTGRRASKNGKVENGLGKKMEKNGQELLLMVQKSGGNAPVEVDGLSVLSHSLKGFKNIQTVVVWDFWTINTMGSRCSHALSRPAK